MPDPIRPEGFDYRSFAVHISLNQRNYGIEFDEGVIEIEFPEPVSARRIIRHQNQIIATDQDGHIYLFNFKKSDLIKRDD